MRKGFSLVEVIIATVIIAVVGISLLEMGTKNQKIDLYIDKKSSLSQYSSIISFHHKSDFNNLDKTLFDFIEKDYDIDHDEVKKFLKSEKVSYKEQEILTLDFGESNESEESKENMRLEIKKAIIFKDKIAADVYFLEY